MPPRPAPLIVPFPGERRPTIDEVGGKGLALLRLAADGFAVPPGWILTRAFFDPWFEQLRRMPAWTALREAAPADWPARSAAVQAVADPLPLEPAQRTALNGLDLQGLYAVRSSSPEEDLAGASFAGGYHTVLGVTPERLEAAVRRCFASSLDARVMVYKQAHGLDPFAASIAVVVQRQLDSQVAGVGFSIDPLSNDYDEAVIDACWGLGESVVGGLVEPDHFRLDKQSGRLLAQRIGAKQRALWLADAGGTVERTGHRADEPCLGPEQLGQLCALLVRVERRLDRPVDIEWAIADGRLYLLQARPITAYVPLPPEMLTPPGERRRLYADAALAKGLTINAPISPLGLDAMDRLFGAVLTSILGPLDPDTPIEDSLTFVAGSRMYANLSNALWMQSPEVMAANSRMSDALMADILAGIDVERYRAARKPAWAGLGALRRLPGLLWRIRRFGWNLLCSLLAPERASRLYRRRIAATRHALTDELDRDLPLPQFVQTVVDRLNSLFDSTMPPLLVGVLAVELARRWQPPESERLTLGFPGNVVVEMGMALFELGRSLPPQAWTDLGRLDERLERRALPPLFLDRWDRFVASFGCRGPGEMDLANPRYGDHPRLALQQISYMTRGGDGGFDPVAAHARHVNERRQTHADLTRRAGWLGRRILRRLDRLIELYAGTRDTPKYHLVLGNFALRRRALAEGRRLTEQGRLDAPEEVFGLTFDDLIRASGDPALDLRELREQRLSFYRTLQTHVRTFPPVIDSRGRILRPVRTERPGELVGMAVSAGRATGPVKLLRDPREKPVEPGDVLVAYTTDPGWTPLFVNAAAVLLEVGGMLQHGAVVAREYGKPCVAGIDRLTARLEDGQRVEVDGSAGVVRLLD